MDQQLIRRLEVTAETIKGAEKPYRYCDTRLREGMALGIALAIQAIKEADECVNLSQLDSDDWNPDLVSENF